MAGKTIELIAYEIEPENAKYVPPSPQQRARRLKEIQSLTKDIHVDLSNFKFDRNEANDYG